MNKALTGTIPLLRMHRVFSRLSYAALAGTVSSIAFVAIVIAHNIEFLAAFASSREVSLGEAAAFLRTFTLAAIAAVPPLDLALAGISALLIGVTVSLSSFYARMHRAAPSLAGSVGILGTISAFLGFGCAACGSVFIASAFAGSLGGLAALLPFGGKEISFLGIALLTFAAYSLARSINRPKVCPI